MATRQAALREAAQGVEREKAVGSAVVLRKRGGGCSFPSCWGEKRRRKKKKKTCPADPLALWRAPRRSLAWIQTSLLNKSTWVWRPKPTHGPLVLKWDLVAPEKWVETSRQNEGSHSTGTERLLRSSAQGTNQQGGRLWAPAPSPVLKSQLDTSFPNFCSPFANAADRTQGLPLAR